jgi:hypothetical protein
MLIDVAHYLDDSVRLVTLSNVYLALAVPGRLTLIYEHCPYLFVVCIQCDHLIRVFLSLLFPTIIYLNFALTITGEILLWIVVGARLELVL